MQNQISAPQTFVAVHERPAAPDPGSDVAVRWIVVLDVRDTDGANLLGQPMSPQFRRRAQAEGALRRVRENYPAAYLQRVRFEAAAFESRTAT